MVRVVRGELKLRLECFPAFDYGRIDHKVELKNNGAVFEAGNVALTLHLDIPLAVHGNGIISEFTLKEGEPTYFLIGGAKKEKFGIQGRTRVDRS